MHSPSEINVEINFEGKLPPPPHQNLHSLITRSLKASPQSAQESDNQTSKPVKACELNYCQLTQCKSKTCQLVKVQAHNAECNSLVVVEFSTIIAYCSTLPLAPTLTALHISEKYAEPALSS